MIQATVQFIQNDWRSHKLRLAAEACGMALSIAVGILLAMTTPYPPMVTCYIGWNIASFTLMLASASRGSVGLTALYGSFLLIDSVGLYRSLAI
jgi:hypothetical protein